MKKNLSLSILFLVFLTCRITSATQADDTTITVTAQNPGATPFIQQLTLTASETSLIKFIKFSIASKPDSVVRPLSGSYSNDYLTERGYLNAVSGEIFLPVYGLYAGFTNTVTLHYQFLDGSSKEDSVTISTDTFDDPCQYDPQTVLQPRTDDTSLSYDYIMVRDRCSTYSPAIIDTDGALRWVGTAGARDSTSGFYDNAFYQVSGVLLYRIELDGTVTLLRDYTDIGLLDLHHTIDRGKTGLIIEADTATHRESTLMEIDLAGNVLKTWDMADIISEAMAAGGDDPSDFVYNSPVDWFHNNASTYNRADDSLIISSRENFVIALDYESATIKWILGDTTKKWYLFPSLQQFALALAPDSLPPIGQHALSITYDQHLLLFDNGLESVFQNPYGVGRDYGSPRKYQLDLEAKVATEVWNYEMDQSIYSPICSSIYEDAPFNYLVDYADVNGPDSETQYAQILGLNTAGEKVFYYQYPTTSCNTAFNSVPLHLEKTSFPTVEPRALNLSTRGLVGTGENSLIGGFIVTGTDSETILLRALGTSLEASGLENTIADPVLQLYDSAGALLAMNDDWESDPEAAQILANGLAPSDSAEAATIQTLAPGAYTFVVAEKNATEGIGLVEAYDLSPLANARMANLSTRGEVGTGDQSLISGFIIGDVESETVVLRALGPSLSSSGISEPLSDPSLTVFDSNGVAIAGNDNWEDDISAANLVQTGLAPGDAAEAATILHLPAGAYTAIVNGVEGATGVGLVEIFDL